MRSARLRIALKQREARVRTEVYVARREAPAVSGNGYGRHRLASLGAPSPFTMGVCSLTGAGRVPRRGNDDACAFA